MPDSIRLVHNMMSDTGLHVITSPDIKGFCIVGETHEEAETEARHALDAIRRNELGPFTKRAIEIEAKAASA